nr:hypothetical protein [Sorangium cellulosum]
MPRENSLQPASSRFQLLDTLLEDGDRLLLCLDDRLLLADLGTEFDILSLQFIDAIVPKGTCHNERYIAALRLRASRRTCSAMALWISQLER